MHTMKIFMNKILLLIVVIITRRTTATTTIKAEKASARIINGEDVLDPRVEYPFMASLASYGSHKCGGVLITPDTILTVGHCIGYFNEIALGKNSYTDYSSIDYESYIIETEAIHPRYYLNEAGDNDPYEMAIVKFYGNTSLQIMEVNRNSSIPLSSSDSATDLLIMGFGVTDPDDLRTPSDVLKRGIVQYIPNEECKNISGFDVARNTTLTMLNKIIDVSLCAADFTDPKQDICSGDSGSPILLPSDDDDSLLLLGVTSGSYYCASDTWPAIYVRTSETIDWITEQVCSLSHYPPSDFNCPPPTDDEEVEQQDVMISLSLEIQLFDYYTEPKEVGWILVSGKKTYGYRGIYSYTTEDLKYRNKKPILLARKIMVPNNQKYNFKLLTRQGGTVESVKLFSEDAVYIRRSQPISSQTYDAQNFNDFIVGTIPTAAPTITPSPSISTVPSAVPTSLAERTTPYFSIEITFDQYTEETGWSMEAVILEGEEERVLDIRYAGSYKYLTNDTTITEIVDLIDDDQVVVQYYRFTMFDNEGDGLCCNYGNGSVSVYYHQNNIATKKTKLFDVGEFYLEDVHIITIPKDDDNGDEDTIIGNPQDDDNDDEDTTTIEKGKKQSTEKGTKQSIEKGKKQSIEKGKKQSIEKGKKQSTGKGKKVTKEPKKQKKETFVRY